MLAMLLVMGLPVIGLLFFLVWPLSVALPLYLAGLALAAVLHRVMYSAMRMPVRTGREGMSQRRATVVSWEDAQGIVRCRDELWHATSDGSPTLVPGDDVVVLDVSKMTLRVRPIGSVDDPAGMGVQARTARDGRRHLIPRSGAATRYNRLASVYDILDAPMEWLDGGARRNRVLGMASGRVLEVGIGTGRNLGAYPAGVRLVGLDIAGRMLARARRRARRLAVSVALLQGDVEHLPFAAATFDTVTATCVFCSVDDPLGGLAEVRRVVKPDGRVLLLEHVRPESWVFGLLFDLLTPLTRLIGPEINRRTEQTAQAAGLELVAVRRVGVWREIVARPVARVAADAGAGGKGAADPH
ncbi:MAG: methyltransferase domain-containing protein [Acidobacteria bacterium]|nr:methyltransferase domain-containing protein [Acidobacteriota bacterium]